MSSAVTLGELRRYAVARTLFAPTTLSRAIDRLGFVQADPIRAPARAQDLTLRHRVRDYRAGDLERKYPRLAIEEDFFVNYGFLPRSLQALMHPRTARTPWTPRTKARAQAILDYLRERGPLHPREVDAHFAHGRVTNDWNGSSNATTRLLAAMHYRGLVRVTRRDSGVRVYAALERTLPPPDAAMRGRNLDRLVDAIVQKYAPLPATTLRGLVNRLRYGSPQWARYLGAALTRAKERLAHARVDGVDWYWPGAEDPRAFRDALDDSVRLLAPFDPVVWDRARFLLLWNWPYRFEAYYPAPRRKFGYYAMPILWQDQVVGWANLAVRDGRLAGDFGYPIRATQPRSFQRGLAAEQERMRVFLDL